MQHFIATGRALLWQTLKFPPLALAHDGGERGDERKEQGSRRFIPRLSLPS